MSRPSVSNLYYTTWTADSPLFPRTTCLREARPLQMIQTCSTTELGLHLDFCGRPGTANVLRFVADAEGHKFECTFVLLLLRIARKRTSTEFIVHTGGPSQSSNHVLASMRLLQDIELRCYGTCIVAKQRYPQAGVLHLLLTRKMHKSCITCTGSRQHWMIVARLDWRLAGCKGGCKGGCNDTLLDGARQHDFQAVYVTCACMCVCLCVFVCICVRVHVCVCAHMWACNWVCVWQWQCINVHDTVWMTCEMCPPVHMPTLNCNGNAGMCTCRATCSWLLILLALP